MIEVADFQKWAENLSSIGHLNQERSAKLNLHAT